MKNPAETSLLANRIRRWIDMLCLDIGPRPTGSPANRRATDAFADELSALGMIPEVMRFDCLHWEDGRASLEIGGRRISSQVSPYSRAGEFEAALAPASTVEEVEAFGEGGLLGRLLLLHGEIASEPLMPKLFPFYNPDHHVRIVEAVERARPVAVIAATGRSPELAGAPYPFPLFEDGDFDLPSVFIKDIAGEEIARRVGERVRLTIESARIPSSACNVSARCGGGRRRMLVTAHIDTKPGTPGALDDAAGIAVLLATAQLLSGDENPPALEVVALNGEDHYSAAGQKAYLAANKGAMEDITLVVNVDGAGSKGARTAISFYGDDTVSSAVFARALGDSERFVEGAPWFQGDHMPFVQIGVPAVAATSEDAETIMREVIHTPEDAPSVVDAETLATLAMAIAEAAKLMTEGTS